MRIKAQVRLLQWGNGMSILLYKSRFVFLVSGAVAVFILGGGISPVAQASSYDNYEDQPEISDPLEPFNRTMYKFNDILDKAIFVPVTKLYRFVVPEMGRKGIHNALRNLSEPVTFVNSILQGDVSHSFTTFWRFAVNSTIGIGGVFEVVEKEGLPHRKEDFGQTMGRYGVGFGPYLVLPIIGPSSTRDALGSVADVFSDPFIYWFSDEALIARSATYALDTRDKTLDITQDIEKISLDPYSTVRSLYTQRRLDAINNGKKTLSQHQ